MSRVWGRGSTAALCCALGCWSCAESETLKHADALDGGASATGGDAGTAQGGSAQGGTGNASQGGDAGSGNASQGGSAQGGSGNANQGGGAQGGSAGQGTGGLGSSGGSTSAGTGAGANGGSAGQPTGMDPALDLPDGNGNPCSNIGNSCNANGDPGICRIYSQTEGRCESCSDCSGLNQFCTQSSDCDILFQCYQGKCMGLCDLGVGCSGELDWCVDVGNDQYGICVYP